MNTTELLAIFRQEVVDFAVPYLWSDALVMTYIDEAQKQFCRDTYGIEDSRGFKILVKADGTQWYAFDPSILKIRGATNSSTGLPVPLIASEKIAAAGIRFDGRTGPLQAFVQGLEKGYLRAYPVPNTAVTVELQTFRLPVDVVAGDDFEISGQHVLNLLHWVKYRAYSVQDSETRDDKKAATHKAIWDAYCAKAKVEQSRVNRPVSVTAYGGI